MHKLLRKLDGSHNMVSYKSKVKSLCTTLLATIMIVMPIVAGTTFEVQAATIQQEETEVISTVIVVGQATTDDVEIGESVEKTETEEVSEEEIAETINKSIEESLENAEVVSEPESEGKGQQVSDMEPVDNAKANEQWKEEEPTNNTESTSSKVIEAKPRIKEKPEKENLEVKEEETMSISPVIEVVLKKKTEKIEIDVEDTTPSNAEPLEEETESNGEDENECETYARALLFENVINETEAQMLIARGNSPENPWTNYTEDDVICLGDAMDAEVCNLLSRSNGKRAFFLTGSVLANRLRKPDLGNQTTIRGVVNTTIGGHPQYASRTRRLIGKMAPMSHGHEATYEWARQLLTYGPIGPDRLVYQAMMRQGRVYDVIGGEYFGVY